MKLEIEVKHFSLDNTFTPSFVSSLYQKVEAGHWVKIAGHLGGQLELRQSQPNVLTVLSKARLTESALRRRVVLETGSIRKNDRGASAEHTAKNRSLS